MGKRVKWGERRGGSTGVNENQGEGEQEGGSELHSLIGCVEGEC